MISWYNLPIVRCRAIVAWGRLLARFPSSIQKKKRSPTAQDSAGEVSGPEITFLLENYWEVNNKTQNLKQAKAIQFSSGAELQLHSQLLWSTGLNGSEIATMNAWDFHAAETSQKSTSVEGWTRSFPCPRFYLCNDWAKDIYLNSNQGNIHTLHKIPNPSKPSTDLCFAGSPGNPHPNA